MHNRRQGSFMPAGTTLRSQRNPKFLAKHPHRPVRGAGRQLDLPRLFIGIIIKIIVKMAIRIEMVNNGHNSDDTKGHWVSQDWCSWCRGLHIRSELYRILRFSSNRPVQKKRNFY